MSSLMPPHRWMLALLAGISANSPKAPTTLIRTSTGWSVNKPTRISKAPHSWNLQTRLKDFEQNVKKYQTCKKLFTEKYTFRASALVFAFEKIPSSKCKRQYPEAYLATLLRSAEHFQMIPVTETRSCVLLAFFSRETSGWRPLYWGTMLQVCLSPAHYRVTQQEDIQMDLSARVAHGSFQKKINVPVTVGGQSPCR